MAGKTAQQWLSDARFGRVALVLRALLLRLRRHLLLLLLQRLQLRRRLLNHLLTNITIESN